MSHTNPNIDVFLEFLQRDALMWQPSWDQYLHIDPPFPQTSFDVQEVSARYHRNGYDWDIHGKLYTPNREVVSNTAIVMVHGGSVNESTFDRVPSNRPGWARIVAAQGFRVLTLSHPGLWPPGGVWPKNPAERKPFFLLDQAIDSRELEDRLLKYSFNLVVHGIATLMDQNLAGRKVFAFGHSIGARLVVDLWRFMHAAHVTGLLGFGSLGPKIWEYELQTKLEQQTGVMSPSEPTPTRQRLTRFLSILPETGKPRIFLPVIRTPIELEACAKLTGLPRDEYFDNTLTQAPDASWLSRIKVLLLIGENDTLRYWRKDRPLEDRLAYHIATRYAETTAGTRLVIVPRFTHTGHLEPQSENMTYLWLWAIKSGWFD
ncbi:MAG: alpha/beta fold hydrolase [Candidatus Hermodarchaeia archaeon]|jgi:pimeloyl-ACP methyl ester carboxylesterase